MEEEVLRRVATSQPKFNVLSRVMDKIVQMPYTLWNSAVPTLL
jgi:hypothetical protein